MRIPDVVPALGRHTRPRRGDRLTRASEDTDVLGHAEST